MKKSLDHKISVVICWPDSFDFPMFRENLVQLNKYVHEVIVVFTKHGDNPIRGWLTRSMDGVIFLNGEDSTRSGDWRSNATNLGIDRATGDWILFLEQDFFIKNYQDFFSKVFSAMEKNNLISFQEDQRLHPAFFLVNQDELNKTDRDFSVLGTHKDHFWSISRQLKGFCSHTYLPDIGLIPGVDWFHMRGLTDNYFAPNPYYDLDNFYLYNDRCKQVACGQYWWSQMHRCSGEYQKECLLGKFWGEK